MNLINLLTNVITTAEKTNVGDYILIIIFFINTTIGFFLTTILFVIKYQKIRKYIEPTNDLKEKIHELELKNIKLELEKNILKDTANK